MKHRIRFFVGLLLFSASTVAGAVGPELSYLHIAQRKDSEGDPSITSLGMLGTQNDTLARLDIVQYRDPLRGEAWSVEFAAGYLVPTQVNIYAGGGVLAGYRRKGGDFFGAYYPEVGAMVPISQGLGVSVSKRRYFKLYDQVEDVIMFGVVFMQR